MSSISRIPGSNNVSRVRESNPNNTSYANFPISFHEKFEFPHKKLTIKEKYNAAALPREREFYKILLKLFFEILESGIDIVPTQPSDTGSYSVEAFFKPAEGTGTRPAIHLPVPIQALGKKILRAPSGPRVDSSFKNNIENYVEKVIQNFTDEQIVRLIIVGSHEFGHYQSYSRGNHDEYLKKGLYIFHKKYLNVEKVDQYTWLVFREECLAWNYAETFLRKTEFDLWDVYEEVKNNSLQTYFKSLNLINASLETYYSLSFLGEDFKKSSSSEFFLDEAKKQLKANTFPE